MDLELDPNHRMAGRMKAGDERGAGRHGEPMSSVAGPSRGGEQGTTNSFVKLTPVQEDASTPAVARSLSYTRPVTRSMGEPLFGPLRPASRKVTLFRRKLSRASNRKSAPPGASSNLEDAKNIVYDGEEPNADVGPDRGHDGHAGVEFGEALESPPLRKPKGRRFSSSQLQAPTRRSARINGLQLQSRDTTPSMSWARQISRAETAPVALEPSGLGRPIRRSARDSKPLLEFHKYSELPPELKIMVWEAAIEPRAVYVRNRSAAPHLLTPADIQIRVPTWFMACQLSAWVARRNYQMLFSPRAPSIPLALLPHQNINPDVDIVVFEPCSSGCRGCYCACHQYTDESRHAVRFLAVQTEPPNLAHSALPCWLTLSLSWPNVETLYLMRQAVKGVDKTDKAIVRVKANSHEEELLKLFSEWKEDIGAHVKLTNIEFVVVVEKETGGDAKDRYKWVPDRATGQLQDVILG
ncbi:hypothetical protein GGS23DRAFT_560203 [Durotheca rogersii]|uniref:uncharacterized protein n=1 Tax=Durotheca rogersii TaxID=419775 RepID=UPI00221EA560|nr:uncharacterized protein GGS23DRAFT_560203 [Durotheca rogersii]KAI5865669.1 hypothetical protein GGS23DRAFT_560203 [Durotheca rogersii]